MIDRVINIFSNWDEQLMKEDLKKLNPAKHLSLVGYFHQEGWLGCKSKLVDLDLNLKCDGVEFNLLSITSIAAGKAEKLLEVNHVVVWNGNGEIQFRGSVTDLKARRGRLSLSGAGSRV